MSTRTEFTPVSSNTSTAEVLLVCQKSKDEPHSISFSAGFNSSIPLVKFEYSEKATKFEKIFHFQIRKKSEVGMILNMWRVVMIAQVI